MSPIANEMSIVNSGSKTKPVARMRLAVMAASIAALVFGGISTEAVAAPFAMTAASKMTADNGIVQVKAARKRVAAPKDRQSTRLNSSHSTLSRMPSSA